MLGAEEAVLLLGREHPAWLPVVQACYEEAARPGRFAGAWVLRRLGQWRPGLRLLVRYGILEKVGETTRGGRRAYYRMPDREGVGRALRELGLVSSP